MSSWGQDLVPFSIRQHVIPTQNDLTDRAEKQLTIGEVQRDFSWLPDPDPLDPLKIPVIGCDLCYSILFHRCEMHGII